MTYEQASVRGLVVRRSDETLLTYRDTVRHHFVASVSTLEAAAGQPRETARRFLPVPATAIEKARKSLSRSTSCRAAATLRHRQAGGHPAEHGAEVKRATAPFHAGDRGLPGGNLRGPHGRSPPSA